MNCLACSNKAGNRSYVAREMMLGTKETFEYIECGACGSLHLNSRPADLGRYYPTDYYSFNIRKRSPLLQFLQSERLGYALRKRGILGWLLCHCAGTPEFVEWIRTANVPQNARILDVGCGAGFLLNELKLAGFGQLTGVDPYLGSDIQAKGLDLRKCCLEDVEDKYDFVVLNHSFEHMPDPLGTLQHLRRVLCVGKAALIRTPVASTWAWRHYGNHWVQLDAPRHLFIPSVAGLRFLLEESGLALGQIVFDSTEYQFWASELCKRGIKFSGVQPSSYFSRHQLNEFRKQADELNRQNDGDSASFYIFKN